MRQTNSVLVFTETMVVGGVRTTIEAQVTSLQEVGKKIFLCSPYPKDWGDSHVDFAFIHVRLPHSFRNFTGLLLARRDFKRAIREVCPSVVIAHGRLAILIELSVRHPHRRVYVNHVERFRQTLKRWVMELAAKEANLAISNTPDFGSGWRYAPVTSSFSKQPHLPKTPPSPGLFTLGWFGRLETPKRPDVWIKVYAEVKQKMRLRGLMIGTGSLATRSRIAMDWPQGEVQFLDYSTPAKAMGAMDVLMCWSDSEGQLPLAAQEAIWFGVPVITNRLPGIEAFLGANMVGIVDSPEEATDLIVKMQDPRFFSHVITQQQNRLKEMMKRPSMNDLIMQFVKEMQ